MAVTIYTLCALTAFVCAWLLLQAYFRSRSHLLLWSGLCFAGLTLNNVVLVVDKLVFLSIDLSVWRALLALASMAILLYGLIWDSE
jgi:hypothetical protein